MMQVLPVDASDLGNRSYLVTDGSSAIAIDPPRPSSEVIEILRAHRLTLKMILDTHLHNDHVSGGPELAAETGAVHAVSADEAVRGARGIGDGERFRVGALRVTAIATPGHTEHHQSFVVSDTDRGVVFTGGSLLVGAAGRTDLSGADKAAALAGAQWSSVRRLLELLSDEAIVHPTHGFGSFCSVTPAEATESTIGEERRSNPAALLDRQTFVETLLGGFDEYPSYFDRMAAVNRKARATRGYLDTVPGLDLRAATTDASTWIVDVRDRASFASGHLPGTINIGADGPLATYLGWVLPWDEPFALVGRDDDELATARTAIARIGLDHPSGMAVLDRRSLSDHLRRATFSDLASEWDDEVTVIDVRRRQEWADGHIRGAHHRPVHRLLEHELPPGRLWVYCAAGYRAMLGASLLKRAGRDVVAVDGPWSGASEAGLPISRSASPRRENASSFALKSSSVA